MSSKKNHDSRTEWTRWKKASGARKKRRQILIAAGLLLLAALVGVLIFVRKMTEEYEASAARAETLTDLTADRIESISYKPAGKDAVAFTRSDGMWSLDEDGPTSQNSEPLPAEQASQNSEVLPAEQASQNSEVLPAEQASQNSEALPVDQTAVGELASSFTGIRLLQTMTDVTDSGQYGLASPSCEITIKDRDGAVIRIWIGDENEAAGAVYCCLDGDTSVVYAVSTSIETNLNKKAEDYLQQAETEE